MRLLAAAHARFARQGAETQRPWREWRREQAWWLDDYCLFAAAKRAHGDRSWIEWDAALGRREAEALQRWRGQLSGPIEFEAFVQYQFARQWSALGEFSRRQGVRLIGDVPIFVAHDSADVWAGQELFALDDGRPTVVAGVPPDYFSASGQRWGNPLYRWELHAATDYAWWLSRLRRALELFDVVRIDHFRGFEAYWEIPADRPDARGGRWLPGPGAALFHAARRELGRLPVIAEDLGVITPEVEQLRDDLELPGMRVLQFAFGDDPKATDYQPHNYPRHCVVYTGTHDNDTTVGWYRSEAGADTTRTDEQVRREQALARCYLNSSGGEVHWDMIRAAWSSVADLAITPLQDVLGLGSEARMNLPGTSQGNWLWRFTRGALTPQHLARLGELTAVFGRTERVRPWFMPRGGGSEEEE